MNNQTLSAALGLLPVTPEPPLMHRWEDYFGLEFEMEDVSGDRVPSLSRWTPHADASLVDGIELVLRMPMRGPDLVAALDEFYNSRIRARGGLRTSTHVHIEGRDLTVDQLRSMIVLMYTIENDLYRYVGENRKWAGYSMSLAEMNPQRLSSILSDNNRSALRTAVGPARGTERYYGFNVSALTRHGSLEFRYFPGMPTRAETESYLDLIQAIKNTARELPVEALIETVTSQDALQALLMNKLPGTIRDRLLSMGTPEQRWDAFAEVATLCEQEEKFVRQDQLIRLTPAFINYLVKSRQLSPLTAQHLKRAVKKIGVMTTRDFTRLLDDALRETLTASGTDGTTPQSDDFEMEASPDSAWSRRHAVLDEMAPDPERDWAAEYEAMRATTSRVVPRLATDEPTLANVEWSVDASARQGPVPTTAPRSRPRPPSGLQWGPVHPFTNQGESI